MIKDRTKIVFIITAAVLITMSVMISGCGMRSVYRPAMMENDEEWMNMVKDYRRSSMQNPGDQEMRASLRNAEFDAAEHFYRQGIEMKNDGKIEGAIASMQKGLVVMPSNEKITNMLAELMAKRESDMSFKEAMIMKESGNVDEAKKLLTRALELDPGNTEVAKELEKINAEKVDLNDPVFSSKKKITIKFMNADLKTVMDFIAGSYGINVIYDEQAKTLPISVSAENVTLDQALKSVMSAAGAFYKKIGDMSLLVIQDTKAKRDQYDELYLRTFQMNSIKASDMANILKNTLNLKRITVNEAINAITIRDTQDILKLAEKIISLNDKKPAEVLFDVEIMEVNRTKSEQLGISYGTQMVMTLPEPSSTGSLVATKFADLINQSTITLPAFTLNFFKQDVDAKMLANPRIRVVEGKQAKVHIGDRVPLRSTTVTDSTGQVRYSYDYKDIGVMLDVTPKINLDNSVSVLINLEVSSLGSNIGTASDPAYSIGTRDAQTTMILRDGETAIIGGLIRDEERHNKTSIPGLGDIPILGSLFTTAMDDTDSRTDVLLTITPRVIRSWELVGKDLRDIYSGTESNISSEPKYIPQQPKKNKAKDVVRDSENAQDMIQDEPVKPAGPGNHDKPDMTPNTINAAAGSVTVTSVDAATAATEPGDVRLAFMDPEYTIQNGQDGSVFVSTENLEDVSSLFVKLAFSPEFVKYKQASGTYGTMTVSDQNSATGNLELNFTFDPDKKQEAKTPIAEIKFSGIKDGASYLVYIDSKAVDKEGNTKNVSKTISRIVVK